MTGAQDNIAYHRRRAADERRYEARAAERTSAIAHACLADLHEARADALERQHGNSAFGRWPDAKADHSEPPMPAAIPVMPAAF